MNEIIIWMAWIIFAACTIISGTLTLFIEPRMRQRSWEEYDAFSRRWLPVAIGTIVVSIILFFLLAILT